MNKEDIIKFIKKAKLEYINEGLEIKGIFGSFLHSDDFNDIDILIEVKPTFANKYGFNSFSKLEEIKNKISNRINKPVDFADITAMGKSAKKFIIDKALYV